MPCRRFITAHPSAGQPPPAWLCRPSPATVCRPCHVPPRLLLPYRRCTAMMGSAWTTCWPCCAPSPARPSTSSAPCGAAAAARGPAPRVAHAGAGQLPFTGRSPRGPAYTPSPCQPAPPGPARPLSPLHPAVFCVFVAPSPRAHAARFAAVPPLCCSASTYDGQIREWIKQDVVHGEIKGASPPST
jgi:hypothetical protein